MDMVALVLSIVSTLLSLFSMYISQFKRGILELLPLRAYRIDPVNYTGEETVRAMRLFVPLTFSNTGAGKQAVHDLRVSVRLGGSEDLILGWENEVASINQQDGGSLASQPTVKGYESVNKIYSFVSDNNPQAGMLVRKLEQTGEAGTSVLATVERRVSRQSWESMGTFRMLHSGRVRFETDYEAINPA